MRPYTRNIVQLYRQTAEHFAAQLTRALKSEVRAVVLYGSAARGDAARSSDINVLVLCTDPDGTRAAIAAIEEEFDAANHYRTFLVSIYFTPTKFKALALTGSPFALNVVGEGVVLYDDGSFSGIREAVLASGRRDARRRKAHARQ